MENKQSNNEDAGTRAERAKNKIDNNRIFVVISLSVALIAGIASTINNLSTIESALHRFLPPSPVYIYYDGASVSGVAWSPDSKRIASSSANGSIQIWDAFTGDNILHRQLSIKDEGYSSGSGIVWSPNGNYIASWTSVEVQIWEATTGKIIQNYKIHNFNDPLDAIDITWSPNSKLIASTSYGTVHIWNILNKKDIRIYPSPNHLGVTLSLAWSPDGNYIASTEDSTVQVWEATSGRLITTYKDSNRIDNIAWSPDSQFIASRTSTAIQIWDAFDGYNSTFPSANGITYNPSSLTCPIYKNALNYILHSPINISWSPNSEYFSYACVDANNTKGVIYIWDFSDQKLFTHHGLIASWSSDSKYLAIAYDLTVEVWQVTDLLRNYPF